jgi:hypothetical protein
MAINVYNSTTSPMQEVSIYGLYVQPIFERVGESILFILSKTNLQGVLLMKPWFARKFHP